VPATVWQLLIVTLLGLPLISPLARWAVVACTHDGHLHTHRVAAMRHAWENGVYFTRWLPDLAFGYGYPFFLYREPTPLYAVLLPHLLGLSLPAASNLFYALCILAAGWFMFLWVKDISGPRAALVSAAAYMAAPYVLIDAFIRGNAPESLALPLLPFLLWIGRRWILQGSMKSFLLSVFGLALLSLSHNISILIFAPFFFLYLLGVGWVRGISWRLLTVRVLLLFGLGLGMSIFYTGGALLEMDQVTLSQSTSTRNNDFHFNFASWAEILALVSAEDPNLINPPLLIRLGWVPLALAVGGLSTLLWKKTRREQRGHVIMMAAAAALFLFMALPAALFLWEKIPLIDFVQFPWRFIGRAALPVAFLAGAPFAQGTAEGAIQPDRKRRLLGQAALVTAVALLVLEAIPYLYPRYCRENLFPSIVDVHDYEEATNLVGIDPEGSYFPRTVGKRPKDSPLQADYREGKDPQRFDILALPDGAEAEVTYHPLSARVRVSSPVPFTARYLSFAFPGWVATIDGQGVAIAASDPDGVITFEVPAGEHEIAIAWQSTTQRTVLAALSLLALVGVGVTAVLLRRHSGSNMVDVAVPEDEDFPYWPLVVLAVALLLFKLLIVDRMETPWRRSGVPPVDRVMRLTAEELQLQGYNLSEEQVESGGLVDIDLAWRLQANTESWYQSNVWLADDDGMLWSAKDTERPRLYEDAPPTSEWLAGQWAWDSREIAVLAGTPPGEYDVVLTLFDLATLQPLTLRDDQGQEVGPTAVIGQIAVTAPEQTAAVKPQFTSGESLPGTGLVLEGYNLGRETMAPGEEILLTLFWGRGTDAAAGTVALQLQSEDGRRVQSWIVPVARDDYDLANWETGQVLRGQYLLRLDAALESGVYDFLLGEQVPVGQVVVNAPERILTEPEMEFVADLLFGERIRLAGYTLTGDPLGVALVWTAVAPVDESYHVFVHLVDEDGTIAAQADGQPANWTRPTSGWMPGEYIIDQHVLTVGPEIQTNKLQLRVGLYDPDTGERLTVAGADFAALELQE
jgi:hypothetical protein